MYQDYDTWVVIDPAVKTWKKIGADSLQGAAEAAALEYDQRPEVDFALTKEGTVVQVLVRDPVNDRSAYVFAVSCTLNPFYEITGTDGTIWVD